MEERDFGLRMTARHSGEGNAVAELRLAMLLDGEWLRSGAPTAEDVRYICERMMACPVSRNLGSASKRATLHLAEHRVVVEG